MEESPIVERKLLVLDPISKDDYMDAVKQIKKRKNPDDKLQVQVINCTGITEQIELLERRNDELELYRKQFSNLEDVLNFKTHCTSCCAHLSTAPDQAKQICTHPLLLITQCLTCNVFYTSGEFEKGEDGSELYCRWCGQGGEVYCCADCVFVFCKACVQRNFPPECFKDIRKNENWKCFACIPEYTVRLRARHWALLKYIEKQKNDISNTKICSDSGAQLMSQDSSKCCRRKRTISEKTPSIKKEKVREKSITPVVQDVADNLHVEPVNADDNLLSVQPASFQPPPHTVAQPAAVFQYSLPPQHPAIPFSGSGISSVESPPISIQQSAVTPIQTNSVVLPPNSLYNIQPNSVMTNTNSQRLSTQPIRNAVNVIPPTRLNQMYNQMPPQGQRQHRPQHINEMQSIYELARMNQRIRLPSGQVIDFNRVVPRNNNSREQILQNNAMLQNMLTARLPPPPLIPSNFNQNVLQPPPHPSPTDALQVNHPPYVPPQDGGSAPIPLDASCTMARTRFDLHLNNALEICQHITQKISRFPSSQAYQQAQSITDIVQLNLHLSYLLDYTVERFQLLQTKCVEDAKLLGRSLKANKDEVEIIEPEANVIDVDADDTDPLINDRRNLANSKRKLESPVTIDTTTKRIPPKEGMTSSDRIYSNNLLHINQKSM